MAKIRNAWWGLPILMSVSAVVAAQVDCVRRQGGGYSCFDHQRGYATDVVPRDGGGVSSFDYESGNYREVVPRRGGGFSTYDSRSAVPREAPQRRGSGYGGYEPGIGSGVPGQGGIGGLDSLPPPPSGAFRRRPDVGTSVEPF